MTELRKARQAERQTGQRKLFPLRLTDFATLREWECFDADSGKDLAVELREYFIPDFSHWKEHDPFEAAFARLLKDLRAEEHAKMAPASALRKLHFRIESGTASSPVGSRQYHACHRRAGGAGILPMKLLLSLALLTTTTLATQAAVTPAEAFASIKKLQGDWRGPAMMKGMPPSRSVFRVTAGGSAVEETIFPGTKMEMVSIYHMDKGHLLMTHYCAIGNQPRMKLNAGKSTATDLVFDFDGGTNLNPRRDMHMHSLHLTLPTPAKTGAQKLQTSGTSWEGGKEKPGSCSVTLTRRS